MISFEKWMEICDYRVTKGQSYLWSCFGPNSYLFERWDEDDRFAVAMVFDTQHHTVYQVEAFDYRNSRAYRLTNPNFAEAFKLECAQSKVNCNEAWDDIEFIDLELESDWCDKAFAIVNRECYDTRVQIELEFDEVELLQYMKQAHEMNITFNEFVERAVEEAARRETQYEAEEK